MKLTIRILLFVLIFALLATTIYSFFVFLPQDLAHAEKIGDKLGYSLAFPFVFMMYACVTFCEVELFFGIRRLLLSISNRKTINIVLSALMILSVILEVFLGLLFVTGNFNPNYMGEMELALFITPICTIALHIFLFSISIVSKIRNSSQKTV